MSSIQSMLPSPPNAQPRRGFSFMEVVVVVLMLGVIGTVAAPISKRASDSDEKQTRRTLAVIRSAIRIYQHTTNEYPPIGMEGEFERAMAPYLTAPIPKPFVLPGKSAGITNRVSPPRVGTSLADQPLADVDAGWVYDRDTGSFTLNTSDSDKAGW